MNKNVLIVSNTADIHADDLVSACERLNVNCFRYNTDDFRMVGELNWNFLGDGVLEMHGRRCGLSEIDLLIYRRPTQVHRYRKDIEPWVGGVIDREWDTLEKAFSLYARGVVMNPIGASAVAQNKLMQIRIANSVGLSVPETLVSSNVSALREFAAKGDCITKGVGSSAFLMDGVLRTARTKRVYQDSFEGQEFVSCPTLLQRYIKPRAMWRMITVGKKTFGFRLQGNVLDIEVDSRIVEDQLDGGLADIPAEVLRGYRSMLDTLSIVYASSDFIEDQDGRIWFVDLNPEGQWGAYEQRFCVPISDEIISLAL